MLAELAERIAAFGPRYRLTLETVQAVESQRGRERAIAFAKEHEDLAVKAMMVMMGDAVLGMKMTTRLNTVLSKWPPNKRKLTKVKRELHKALERMEHGLHEAAERQKEIG